MIEIEWGLIRMRDSQKRTVKVPPRSILKDVLYGLPHLEARKEKTKANTNRWNAGFTERDFLYPDTDFYHFINGDKVKYYITIKIGIISEI